MWQETRGNMDCWGKGGALPPPALQTTIGSVGIAPGTRVLLLLMNMLCSEIIVGREP